MPAPSPQLSIVVPSFNEEARLPPTLQRILDFVERRRVATEVLVVDDGSSDRTAEVAAEHSPRGVEVIRLGENRGKGAAVRAGVLASRGDEVLISDADLSTPIEELEKLRRHLDDAEIVIGSRAHRESTITEHQPLYRELMGKTFNKIIRVLAVRGIADTQCGFKLLRGPVARDLFARIVTSGFAFDVELLWLARKQGLRIAEVGVLWHNSPDTRVHALFDPPRMILEIVRFRWRHWRRGS